ncbi:MAG TPA: sterol desaturase family protein [Nocardioidaceae bacterium]|nr:sterol desaturase family protein [Nocardioidaceae bacterium]
MTRPSPEVEKLAQERLAADEKRITGTRRTSITLGDAWRAFLRHPSPWMLGPALALTVAARVVVGDYRWTDAVAPAALVAAFPFVEWLIHVCVLHWRPRRLGPVELDSLLARKHRAHHADPRDIPLVFIPWRALAWIIPVYAVLSFVVFPRAGLALSFLVSTAALACMYEWTHYLVHSDYRPRSKFYRAVWRNHRLHHYKNEHYWFGVATPGTADRLLGTCPATHEVETSPTVRALHASEAV